MTLEGKTIKQGNGSVCLGGTVTEDRRWEKYVIIVSM